MKLPLSNGCYIDPCNPALLYDNPDEPKVEVVKLSQAEIEKIELNKKIEKLKDDVE